MFEAGALGIETAQLLADCEAAVQGLARLMEWPLMVSVACAAQTLDRLIDAREYADYAVHDRDELPPFLPSEARVRALSQWSLHHVRSLVHDAERLVEADERPRALALLRRWLEGLDFGQVVGLLGDGLADQFQVPGRESEISEEAMSVIERLGRLCGRLRWVLPPGQSAARLYGTSLFAFERGYVAATLESEAATLSALFAEYQSALHWELGVRPPRSCGISPLGDGSGGSGKPPAQPPVLASPPAGRTHGVGSPIGRRRGRTRVAGPNQRTGVRDRPQTDLQL